MGSDPESSTPRVPNAVCWLTAYLAGFPPVGLHALCWTHGLTSMSLTKAQYAETIFRMAKTKTWTS